MIFRIAILTVLFFSLNFTPATTALAKKSKLTKIQKLAKKFDRVRSEKKRKKLFKKIEKVAKNFGDWQVVWKVDHCSPSFYFASPPLCRKALMFMYNSATSFDELMSMNPDLTRHVLRYVLSKKLSKRIFEAATSAEELRTVITKVKIDDSDWEKAMEKLTKLTKKREHWAFMYAAYQSKRQFQKANKVFEEKLMPDLKTTTEHCQLIKKMLAALDRLGQQDLKPDVLPGFMIRAIKVAKTWADLKLVWSSFNGFAASPVDVLKVLIAHGETFPDTPLKNIRLTLYRDLLKKRTKKK